MFCPGTSVLADGRIVVTGGNAASATSIYDPLNHTWRVGPKTKVGRGYHSSATLSDGRVFTLGGSWNGPRGGKFGEVYNENGTEQWTLKPGIPCNGTVLTNDTAGIYRSDNHMWFFEHTDGRILHAGPGKQMNWISLMGDGSITPTV